MLRDVPKMVEMTRQIVDIVAPLPVTVKTRLGWDDANKNIVDIAERLQDVGIAALAVHGRTREQMYRGDADWTLIGAVKRNPRIHSPVIGNGDVDSPQRAREMFERYGVDGIMLGRAAVGCPWIFRHIKTYLQTGELLPLPDVSERVRIALLHFEKSLEYKQGKRAILEMRRHFNHYFKGVDNFKSTRLQLLTSDNVDEIRDILRAIPERYGGVAFQ
jgi:nifR3 family TIM-barrel protein